MPKPTNLIVFLSDGHNKNVAGFSGHSTVRTPNLDRLANGGSWFTDAYCASPICCPARAAIATGRYPHQSGYWDMCIGYDGRVKSWMHYLRELGHDVVSVGKLHFRSSQDDNGFSREVEPMHMLDGKGPLPMLLRCDGEEPPLEGQWKMYSERAGVGVSHYQEYDRRIADQAIDWLHENGRKSGKPWVLFVSFVSAHPPFEVPEALWDLYDEDEIPLPSDFTPARRPNHPAIEALRSHLCATDLDEKTLRRMHHGYLALVTFLDEQIGRVADAVTEHHLTESTRFIYTSDHGDMLGAHGLLGKFNMYEESVGVPFLICGAEVPKARVQQVASHVDLFPTILECVGAPPVEAALPGISLWPSIEGREAEERSVFAEYHATGSRSGVFMVRRGPWKLIEHLGFPPQLFDLGSDPGEFDDVSETPEGRQKVEELRAELRTVGDVEAIDRRAKADQRAKMAFWGGKQVIRQMGSLLFSPSPGAPPEIIPPSAER